MESNRRKTFQTKVRESNIENLKAYTMGFTKNRRNFITNKYGKILDLLSVLVQKDAITAFA